MGYDGKTPDFQRVEVRRIPKMGSMLREAVEGYKDIVEMLDEGERDRNVDELV